MEQELQPFDNITDEHAIVELFRDVVETSQDLIFQCDIEGRYTYLNPAWERTFGYSIPEMLGKKFTEFQDPQVAARDRIEFSHILQGNVVQGFETVHKSKNGKPINLRFFAKHVRNVAGEIIGTRGIAQDITEQKLTEENLRLHQHELDMQNDELRSTQKELETSRARYFSLYDQAPVGYCTLSEKGLILEANLTASTLLGETRGALSQQPITRFIFIDDQDIFYLHRKRLFATANPQACELRMNRSNASPLWVRMNATLAQFPDGQPVCRIVISDITHRKIAELQRETALAQLQQSEARYMAIIEEQTELVCRYLPDGRLSFVNEAYARYFGQNRQDIMNRNYIPNIPESELPSIQEHLAGITPQNPLAEFEHMVIMPDLCERRQHWIHRGIYSPEGKLLETQAVGRDITQNYFTEQERERLLEELARKNEDLERFTYTASHDLKSPLFTIQGLAHEVEMCLAENDLDAIKDYLSHIQKVAQKMGGMLQDLIQLARVGQSAIALKPVALTGVLGDVRDALAGALTHNNVALEISTTLPTILGCPTRLGQLFQNLIENAIKFRCAEGTPIIDIGCNETPSHWNLYVKDNGLGIAPAHQKSIFGLFSKLNPKSEGSGIGLALVNSIARIHRAQIEVESAGEGLGCTFWIHFPKR